MRFGLLGCAAALTLIGAAAAQAETIYVERGYAEPAMSQQGPAIFTQSQHHLLLRVTSLGDLLPWWSQNPCR